MVKQSPSPPPLSSPTVDRKTAVPDGSPRGAAAGLCRATRSRNVRCGLLLLQVSVICLLLYDHISSPCLTDPGYGSQSGVRSARVICGFRGQVTRPQAPGQAAEGPWEEPDPPKRLFYNRVPKCGSHTFLDVINQMSHLHNFTFQRAPEYMRFYIEDYWQMKFVARVRKIRTPMIYERHLHFLDFRHYGLDQPIYINLIRDPLERLISWYYFRRFQNGHRRNMTEEKRKRTFDNCVLGNHSECVDMNGNDPEEGYFKIIPFFCGQQAFCREDNQRALQAAMRHVETYYLVVGVTEQFPAFIASLEHLLPEYFQGANSFYVESALQLKAKHKTVRKLVPSAQVTAIMKKKLQNEYIFYRFIRQRFNTLLDRLRRTPDISRNRILHRGKR